LLHYLAKFVSQQLFDLKVSQNRGDARGAKHDMAIVRCPSLCPSVCLFVTSVICDYIGWVTSKVITRIISLGSSLLRSKHRRSSPMGTPLKFGGIGVRSLFSAKTCNIFETGQVRTNRKLHTRFRLVVPKHQRPWMTFSGHYALYFKIHAFSEPTMKM